MALLVLTSLTLQGAKVADHCMVYPTSLTTKLDAVDVHLAMQT